jgi:hypothetical protein
MYFKKQKTENQYSLPSPTRIVKLKANRLCGLRVLWLTVLLLLNVICAVALAQEKVIGSKDNTQNNNKINIDITSHLGDNRTFTEGDIISFLVSLDRDAYILIIYQDAEGNTIQIYPNRQDDSGFQKADLFANVLGEEASYEFIVGKPFGREQVWAFAASEPFPKIPGTTIKPGLRLLQYQPEAVFELIRSYGLRPGIAFGEDVMTIKTVPKR